MDAEITDGGNTAEAATPVGLKSAQVGLFGAKAVMFVCVEFSGVELIMTENNTIKHISVSRDNAFLKKTKFTYLYETLKLLKTSCKKYKKTSICVLSPPFL